MMYATGKKTMVVVLTICVAVFAGCKSKESKKETKKEEPKKAEPRAPAPRPEAPGKVVVSRPKGDLPGGVQVKTGGKSVWPPKGPGCDKLVKCCAAATRVTRTAGLTCQLSVAKKPVDCNKALVTVTKVIKELGKTPPKECSQ